MIRKRILLFVLGLFIVVQSVNAQINYPDQYRMAKRFFHDGQYNLAMEGFKALIPYDQKNPFSEYASFYYALSAYHLGYGSVARDMLSQIKNLYPTWDKLDEVNIWMAKIHFDKQEYFQGLQALSQIKESKKVKEAAALKKQMVASIQDIEALKSLSLQYTQDEIIAHKLAKELAKNLVTEEDRQLLERLVSMFRFKKGDFIPEVPPSVKKDVYSVSVLFPFVVNTLDPTPNRKRNQFVLDLYLGMKLAVDTLAKQGVAISLRAYDTERNPEKLKKLLERNEIKNTDLIIGPLFQEENAIVQEFSKAHQINLFNPISSNLDVIAKNPYGFLFQASNETIGDHSAKFLATHQPKKKCIVFYGETKRDSIVAANFIRSANESGRKILRAERVSKEGSRKIIDILATPTEYDEFKYPKQFSLPKDSLGAVFVASDDPLIYTKVLSSVETRGDNVTVLGFESWLDQAAVDYEKYQSLNIVLAAPNFTSSDNRWYQAFQRKFIKTHGRTSSAAAYSNYAKTGYDMMLFLGTMLKKHGVYFQEAFAKESVPGFLTEGYDYRNSHDNHLIPFIRFEGGKLVVLYK
jgi:hypothetical protein